MKSPHISRESPLFPSHKLGQTTFWSHTSRNKRRSQYTNHPQKQSTFPRIQETHKKTLLFTEIQSNTYTQLNNYQIFIANLLTQFKETDGQNNPISLRHYSSPFIVLSWHNHFISTSKSFSILSTLPVSNSNYSRSTLLFVEKRLLLHTDTPVPWQPSLPSSPECMPTVPSSVQQFPAGPSQTTYNRADRKEKLIDEQNLHTQHV